MGCFFCSEVYCSEVFCEQKVGLLLKVTPLMKVVGFQFHLFLSVCSPATMSSTFLHYRFCWYLSIVVITPHLIFAVLVCVFISLNRHVSVLFLWKSWDKYTHSITVHKHFMYILFQDLSVLRLSIFFHASMQVNTNFFLQVNKETLRRCICQNVWSHMLH